MVQCHVLWHYAVCCDDVPSAVLISWQVDLCHLRCSHSTCVICLVIVIVVADRHCATLPLMTRVCHYHSTLALPIRCLSTP